MVSVLAMDGDRLTHLSRLGARTLCGRLVKFETTTTGQPCPLCAQQAAAATPTQRDTQPLPARAT
jgi:hypothetical protein